MTSEVEPGRLLRYPRRKGKRPRKRPMTAYDEGDAGLRWTPVAKAAQLAGLHVDTLRSWARKGEVRSMRDNRRRLMIDLGDLGRRQGVSLDAYDGAEDTIEDDHRSFPMMAAWADELRERIEELGGEVERLRGAELTVARLEERRAADEEAKAALRERVEELKADLDRERRRAEEAERRQAEQDRRLDEILRELGELREERRRWPGLRRWWRRFVEGEG